MCLPISPLRQYTFALHRRQKSPLLGLHQTTYNLVIYLHFNKLPLLQARKSPDETA